jgi:5-methyltetrahydropteroyltriglutamate--homocysteine methyltransferase
MTITANLGFPRVGKFRELKKSLENFWKGRETQAQLQETAKEIRKTNWLLQKKAGITQIPSNDFSFYDQILDLSATLGVVPARYNFSADKVDLETYFAMARGIQKGGKDVVAMEMTKWFDTNYHYIVPEFTKGQKFSLKSEKIFNEFQEAKELGITTRPVIVGPVSYLLLGKVREENVKVTDFLDDILPVYSQILQRLEELGAESVQIDEPFLVMDLDESAQAAYKKAYEVLSKTKLDIHVATYFGELGNNLDLAVNLPSKGLHIDLVRGESQLDDVLANIDGEKILSLGVVDGRNIWKNDFQKSLALINKAQDKLGSERVIISGSCSLLHSPVDLDSEDKLDAELKNWLAFATQKLSEITILQQASADPAAVKQALADNAAAMESRATSTKIHDAAVKSRSEAVIDADYQRNSPFADRIKKQQEALRLPLLPTTTIGSFPQTKELRQQRAKFKKGELSRADYDKYLEKETIQTIKFQEEAGLDVLVHGEYERNDMVEYFGEKLSGFAFSKFGWVQSYGSRCVKPPIIFGDVSRPEAMTVRWTKFAQEQTHSWMKGMLTGPITILQWSFVRNDQPRSETCKQIALAIRDEVVDLESAGIKVIQIDEPAIREGLPLRRSDWAAYLKWAVDAFRLSAAGVEDSTQIHTHMCYSEFNDIIDSIAALDADVISIETSRSAMELLDAFVKFKYPNEIGPGVYDIHSPRVPKESEMKHLLEKALKVLNVNQVWVNPDCGLKTRDWPEVKDSLNAMVSATRQIRANLPDDVSEQAS